MRIAQFCERHMVGRTSKQAILLFLVLATVAANTLLILFVLGAFTLWESVIALLTLLILTAGSMWSVFEIVRRDLGAADWERRQSEATGD